MRMVECFRDAAHESMQLLADLALLCDVFTLRHAYFLYPLSTA